ncbi:GTPase HflX [Aedoeadaptatus acetigenes]|uniref:GTPase HflX n=1 Tax=Aedoeadaptatus acetigenes TaxID=2981723 RepID=UPI0011DD330B|nr:GTPase HflX [Aedoeadaptatus acetigenes]MCU6785727.1 GTPase HflX [Aedoeadaptatus acetigenes]
MEEREKVVTASVYDESETYYEESLKELNALVKVAGGRVVASIEQKVRAYNPATLMGKGKLEELKDFVRAEDVDLVIFDQTLSGVQMREIEKVLEVDVLDRTALILDIFASRAKTDVGKLQVYLAQLEYGKSHLIGKKNYSRLGGGIGTRGPGEQKLEIDRRRIAGDIQRVKKKLKQARKIRDTGRKNRISSQVPAIALVGYTNAGKSSVMNRLLKESNAKGREVYVEDMPFASLDPDTRRIRLPDGLVVYVTDTVGFISNLPTTLVEAFHTTLEELKESDLIVHVIDGSAEDAALRYETTRKLLNDLGAADVPSLLFVNKKDLMEGKKLPFMPAEETVIYGSCKHDRDFDYFYDAVQRKVEDLYVKVDLKFSFNEMDRVEAVKANYPVERLDYDADGVTMTATLPKRVYDRMKPYIRRRYV